MVTPGSRTVTPEAAISYTSGKRRFATFLTNSDFTALQELANELLRLSFSVYKNVRDIARNTLERLLKRYSALAPAALPPVLLAVSGALSGVRTASTSCRWSDLPPHTFKHATNRRMRSAIHCWLT